jgi:hypothetical protein
LGREERRDLGSGGGGGGGGGGVVVVVGGAGGGEQEEVEGNRPRRRDTCSDTKRARIVVGHVTLRLADAPSAVINGRKRASEGTLL